MRSKRTALGILVLLLAAAPGLAEHHETEAGADTGAYARNVAFVGDRAVQLAEAIPEETYGWRPTEGVRSVSEAIMHMAAANYFFAGQLGTAPPVGVDPQALEEITDKAKCVEVLGESMKHIQTALGAVDDVQATQDLFGREMTAEDVMQIAVGHVHEHFGQLIAYARSNGVVPPWSQPSGDG